MCLTRDEGHTNIFAIIIAFLLLQSMAHRFQGDRNDRGNYNFSFIKMFPSM